MSVHAAACYAHMRKGYLVKILSQGLAGLVVDNATR